MARVRRQAAGRAALIDPWRHGGLGLPASPHQRGLSGGSMQNRVYKPELKRAVEAPGRESQAPVDEPPAPAAVPAFLPVGVVQAAAGSEASDRSGVEVVIGAGRRVVIRAGFDAETLRRVAAVPEGRMC